LGDASGISRQAVSQSIKENRPLKSENYIGMSDELDVSIDDLLRCGKRRETKLYKFSRLPLAKLIKTEKPSEPDGLGKYLLVYILETNDTEKFSSMVEKGLFHTSLYNNLHVINFLIRNKRDDILSGIIKSTYVDHKLNNKQVFKRCFDFPPLSHEFDDTGIIKQGDEKLYYELNENQKEFVDTILNTSSERIMDVLPYGKIGPSSWQYPILFSFAIEKDNVFVVDYYLNKHGGNIVQYYFDLATRNHSTKVAKFIFEHKRFERERSIQNLKKIRDTRYVKNMKDKIDNREINAES
jgi:hypothetical protein